VHLVITVKEAEEEDLDLVKDELLFLKKLYLD